MRATRETRPLVYAITNFVAASFQANVVIASGASPVMSPCIEEAGTLAEVSGGVLVNTGTPSEHREELIRKALQKAGEAGRVTLLDPVGYGASSFRSELVDSLIRNFRFSMIKGNHAEIALLAGMDADARGVDSGRTPEPLSSAPKILAEKTGALVCASGKQDFLSDGENVISISGGSVFLGRITGGGCALGALMLSLAAGSGSPLAGAFCGVLMFRLAAELAEKMSRGPGTFQACFLDALHEIQPDDLLSEGYRIEQWKG